MVVGLSFQNGMRPVDLFNGERTNHLMGEGHWTQAPKLMGFGSNAFVKSVRPTDDPHGMLEPAVLKLSKMLSALQR